MAAAAGRELERRRAEGSQGRRNNGTMSRDGNGRPGARRVPSRFHARSARPRVGVKRARPASESSRRGGCRQPGVRDPRTPSRRPSLHRQVRLTVTASRSGSSTLSTGRRGNRAHAGRARIPLGVGERRGHVSDEQLKADRIVVEKAAAHLRRPAILAGYAGLEHK
jgi:hypothetical protein